MSRYGWKPYVPVATRRARALKKVETLRKKGGDIKPVEIQGRKIAQTFWGAAWCDHLESFSDYQNRLPRGRTYVRNGSVCHLEIAKGEVTAMVSGSRLYDVSIGIKTLPSQKWTEVKKRCAGQIGSLLELLQGRLSENVMTVVTNRENGLFPLPGEISLRCSCPDWAVMCKHVAAVLYGVGARLDSQPELLFLLRGVDHHELIAAEICVGAADELKGGRRRIADDELADLFGIELAEDISTAQAASAPRPGKSTSTSKRTSAPAAKRAVKRKAATGAKKNRKPPASGGAGKGVAPQVHPITGRSVAELRNKFDMTQGEFARLLGVSAPCISNWEKKPGALRLQARTLEAWLGTQRLTRRQARRKLDNS